MDQRGYDKCRSRLRIDEMACRAVCVPMDSATATVGPKAILNTNPESRNRSLLSKPIHHPIPIASTYN